jgi:hypothetical protein
MPIIPVFQESKNQLPEAPPSTDINTERFGRDAAALANLGGELGDLGNRLATARKNPITMLPRLSELCVLIVLFLSCAISF